MGWEALIPIIAQYGIPLAESLFQKWTSGTPPTAADFAELRSLAGQSAQDRAKAVAVQGGLTLSDPKVAAIVELTK